MCLLSTPNDVYVSREYSVLYLGNSFERNVVIWVNVEEKFLRFKSKWYSILTRIHIQSSNIKSNKNLNFQKEEKKSFRVLSSNIFCIQNH